MSTVQQYNVRHSWLDWLDGRNAWQFVGILYAMRWIALVPATLLTTILFTAEQQSTAHVPKEWSSYPALGLFISLVILSPFIETVIECAVPYWIIAKASDYKNHRPKRSWGFVILSAGVMVVLHPLGSLFLAFVTGAFLAYCFAHFAPVGTGKAILATACFHGAINIVGFTIILL